MSATHDRITDIWGPRTPHEGPDWPVLVDQNVAEDPDRWVQASCSLCSNGCGIDIGIKDDQPSGRIVGVRGRGDRRGQLWPSRSQGTLQLGCQCQLGPALRRTDLHFSTDPDDCESYGHDLLTGAPIKANDYRAKEPNGRAFLCPAEYIPPMEEPDEEYPFLLTTGHLVYHFYTRTKTG
jgi:anaerobic selenocysteine-containing dehydrogenase